MSIYKPGDFVKLEGQDSVAEVLSVKGNELEVMVGVMKIKVKASKVTKAEAPEEEYEEEVEDIMQSCWYKYKRKTDALQI